MIHTIYKSLFSIQMGQSASSYGLVRLIWDVLDFSWNKLWVGPQGDSSNEQKDPSTHVIQLSIPVWLKY